MQDRAALGAGLTSTGKNLAVQGQGRDCHGGCLFADSSILRLFVVDAAWSLGALRFTGRAKTRSYDTRPLGFGAKRYELHPRQAVMDKYSQPS